MSKLTDLKEVILTCTHCELHRAGGGPVPFRGKPSSIMILGEAPGRTEDEAGRPFVGQAGQLLWKQLAKLQISQDDVFVANTICCWPNRSPATPTREEIYACRGNLYEQIKLCDPIVILALGRIANATLHHDNSMSDLHGTWYMFPWFLNSDGQDIMVMPTYHPAAVLRNQMLMRPWSNDLKTFNRGVIKWGA